MKSTTLVLAVLGLALGANPARASFSSNLMAGLEGLPARPTDPNHPGSADYRYAATTRTTLQIQGRSVDVVRPTEAEPGLPVIVFGHGQAMGLDPYVKLFDHVVRKGAVVIFPQFDTGFFDRDFRRMARDFSVLAAEAIRQLGPAVDPSAVVFSGHSKGAYVALNALGLPEALRALTPKQATLISVAGSDATLLRQVPRGIPVTLMIGDRDTITPLKLTEEAFAGLSAQPKQRIIVKSYDSTSPTIEADHFHLITGTFLNQRKSEGPLHWYGFWKWLAASVEDVRSGSRAQNPYLWGDAALETGLAGSRHQRN